ncbi:MAG: flagellar biosynthetic protein FliR [Acidobacteriaceae bacterium]|nr:flagellar biosynthetic protein FliR [Acidobacteriaceae bacterium]
MPIRVHFGSEALYGFLLTLTRTGSALFLLPLPAFREIALPARIVLILGITVALMPVWPVVHLDSLSGAQFFLTVIAEIAFGLLVGLAISFLNATFQFAAQTISMQAGFSFASTFDPTSQADTTVFQMLAQLVSGLLFFSLGIHRQLLRLLAHSFDVFSPDRNVLSHASLGALAKLGAMMFSTGLRLGLPVVALLLLTEVALAVLGRLHSQLHLIMLTFPVKTALSFAFLAAILTRWPTLYEQTARRVFQTLAEFGLP